MRLLVIGASGFLGGRLVRIARAQRIQVLGTRSSSPDPSLLPFDLMRDRIREVVPRSFFQAEAVTTVIATVSGRMEAIARDPQRCRAVDVVKTVRLIEDLREVGAIPVFVSTSFVFDGERGGYTENEPRNPISHYGRNKAEVEEWIERNAPEAFVPRLDKLVGTDSAEPHLFSEWLAWAEARQPLVCMEGQVFSATLVEDAAAAILRGCELGLRGTYHVASPEAHSRESLAREFLQLAGLDVPVETRTQKELGFLDLRPSRSFLDVTRFQQATGFRFTPMRHALQTFLRAARPSEEGGATRAP